VVDIASNVMEYEKSLGELFIESEDGVCDVKEQEVAYI